MHNLDNDQQNALDGLYDWFFSQSREQYVCVSGYAGTGKSYLIKVLSNVLNEAKPNIRIAYCCLTAKAALVLKQNGIDSARTIHNLIYEVKYTKDKKGNVVVHFYKKKILPFDLIIIDEASMVSEKLFDDICDYGIPIICVGDSFQLPPIEGSFNLMDDKNVNFRLTQIHRQNKGNEIIELSERVRNGEHIPFHKSNDTRKINVKDLDLDDFVNFNQIITGKNSNRVLYNQLYREVKGYKSKLPERNEKLIFLKNDYKLNVFNGEQIILTDYPIVVGKNLIKIKYFDITYDLMDMLDAKELDQTVTTECFNVADPSNVILNYKSKNKQDKAFVDYGYVISCHRSQGSQWENVCVLDDNFGCWDHLLRQRWLYTAITRASEKLCIVKL